MKCTKLFILATALFLSFGSLAQVPGGFYRASEPAGDEGSEKAERKEKEKVDRFASELDLSSWEEANKGSKLLFFAAQTGQSVEARLYFLQLNEKEERIFYQLLRYFGLEDKLIIKDGKSRIPSGDRSLTRS